jgi:phage host-nuclease inhibitor protein Gam
MPIELVQTREVEEYQDEQDPEVKGPWQITDLGGVDWALSRLGECEQETEEINAQRVAAIAAIEARVEKLQLRAARGAAFFRTKLAIWAENNPDAIRQGKKKSRTFLHGSVGTRKKGGRLVVTDHDALVAWVREQPPEKGLFRIKVEPEMKEIQKLYAFGGEVPPGTDFDPERDEIEIKAEQLTKAIQPVKE